MANSGSYTMNCDFDKSADAVKFIVENSDKTPMPEMHLTGVSMYGEYKYDNKTKKYDYTKRCFRVSLSWRTNKDGAEYAGEDCAMPTSLD